jgi:hypothetical protein
VRFEPLGGAEKEGYWMFATSTPTREILWLPSSRREEIPEFGSHFTFGRLGLDDDAKLKFGALRVYSVDLRSNFSGVDRILGAIIGTEHVDRLSQNELSRHRLEQTVCGYDLDEIPQLEPIGGESFVQRRLAEQLRKTA